MVLVLVDDHFDKVDSVFTDSVRYAYENVTRLICLGYRRIGFITECFGDLSSTERFEGYKLALKKHWFRYDELLTAEGIAEEA